MVLPPDLAGTKNGTLPDNLLTKCVYPNTQSARLHSLTNRAMMALFATVKAKYGETLTVISWPDAYRNYTQQYNTFMKRYQTTPISGRPTKVWNGQTWYLKPGMAGAATPGSSNHGWGCALDTGLWKLVSGVMKVVSITAAKCWTSGWILEHADEYGVCWEAQSEPWHIRMYTGKLTPAVLAYEAGQGGGTPEGTFIVNAVRKNLVQGSTEKFQVKRMQNNLNLLGANPPLKVDGGFGSVTKGALVAYQKSHGLTADGECGPQTWDSLENATS